ncbi:hypothetical protein [Hyunsoonleella pacifica]|uniref:Tetratricopeptide repeat protein n=1 Tax=Hyunsoonleella pacifica TaxID=1080224 RepID=A0A4Q9FQX9_9FLAO|nr:hypothetical protein [Hyunsoonleella pacifica]TBN17790.1 hypothetical protein EYD46_05620 [Hyunsoonleella pacifica]GGD08942.1 hypothetical protein GCM10011368_08590 [Hyunsoonleella pacifica]
MERIRYLNFEKAEKLFEARKTALHTDNIMYFIAFYTALNSILSQFDQLRFVGLALNVCTVIDELINNAPTIMIIIGLFINGLIICFFIYLAIRAKKRELWAYKLTLIIYFLDTILIFVLPYEHKISTFVLHVFCFWLIWQEYKEYKDYFILERDLYLPEWALSKESNVLFIKKTDFDLQPNEASQILNYKIAVQYHEQGRIANAIKYYTDAINIWKHIPIVDNKDRDWFSLALMNRAVLKSSKKNRYYNESLKDLILAYTNFKTLIHDEVKPLDVNQYTNQINSYENYYYVEEYFVECSYWTLKYLMNNLNNDPAILKFGKIILGIESTKTKYLLNDLYMDSLDLINKYHVDIWHNKWTSKILSEIIIPIDKTRFSYKKGPFFND